MSLEDLFAHGILKGEVCASLHRLVKCNSWGHLFVDRARVSCPAANLSVEPDIVFVSTASLKSGRVSLAPKAGGQPGRYVELVGSPDLVVEIVSDASVAKDTQRLPAAYLVAGVREFWLADARTDELLFQIHARGPSGFEPLDRDRDGYQLSAVFRRRFRLDRVRDANGYWAFDLLDQ